MAIKWIRGSIGAGFQIFTQANNSPGVYADAAARDLYFETLPDGPPDLQRLVDNEFLIIKLEDDGEGEIAYQQANIPAPWNITESKFLDGSTYDTSDQETRPAGLAFNDNGTKVFWIGGNTDTVYQVDLLVPYTMSSGVDSGVSFDLNGQAPFITGGSCVFFKTDGTKMFITDLGPDIIYEFDLPTGFDLSAVNYNGVSFDASNENEVLQGLAFKLDGKRMYTSDQGNSGKAHQYDLGVDWDVSSAVYNGVTFNIGAQDASPQDIALRPGGAQMFFVGNINDKIYNYDLGVADDIGSAVFNGEFSVAGEMSLPSGLIFNPDGSRCFVADNTGGMLVQYELQEPTFLDVTSLVQGEEGAPGATGNSFFFESIVARDAFFNDGTNSALLKTNLPVQVNIGITTTVFYWSGDDLPASYDADLFRPADLGSSPGPYSFGQDGLSISSAARALNLTDAYGQFAIPLTTEFDMTESVPPFHYGFGMTAIIPLADVFDTLLSDPQDVLFSSVIGDSMTSGYRIRPATMGKLRVQAFAGTLDTDPVILDITIGILIGDIGTTKLVGLDNKLLMRDGDAVLVRFSGQQLFGGLQTSGLFNGQTVPYLDANSASLTPHAITSDDSVVTIRTEADFPDPIVGPDGEMRIPLDITKAYRFDLGELEVETPFLLPERLLGLERVRMQSLTNTTFIYTGTATLFYGRNASALESDKVDWVAQTPGTRCFDVVGGFGLVSYTIFNTAFLDWDMGSIDGVALFGRRFGMVRPRAPLRLHNLSRCFIDNLRFVTPPSTTMSPNFVLTGGDGLANPKFENTIVQAIGYDQSFFAIDAGSSYAQVQFENIPFDGMGGTFFEKPIRGDNTAYANLVSLITGSPTEYLLYSDDGTNNTIVTDVAHSVYPGLVVDHSGTPGGVYDGQHIVTRVPDLDHYVMDILYVSDETSGSYTGIGTRITTAPILPWEIASASFSGNIFNIIFEEEDPFAVQFKPDGLKMFVVGTDSMTVYAYDLTSPWLVTSARYNGEFFNVSGQDTLPVGVSFKPDGTKMFIAGGTNDTIFAYDLFFDWDVSTAMYNAEFKLIAEESLIRGFTFKPDGDKMFVVGLTEADVFAYDLGTDWDISSAVYNGEFFPVAQDGSPQSVDFRDDGEKMFVSGQANDRIFAYDLSAAWDASSASYNGEFFNPVNEENNMRDVVFKTDGSDMFVLGMEKMEVIAYSLSAAFSLTEHRTVEITGSGVGAYDQPGLEVLNVADPVFDITVPFVSNPATGAYVGSSLDQTDITVLAENNAALPDSRSTGEVNLAVPVIAVAGSNDDFVEIGGSDWTATNLEEFTATTAGVLTYIGLNPASFIALATATLEKTGGSSANLAQRIAVNGNTLASSQGATQNSTPTQVTSTAIVELRPGDNVFSFVHNIDTGDTVDVNLATLLVSGM